MPQFASVYKAKDFGFANTTFTTSLQSFKLSSQRDNTILQLPLQESLCKTLASFRHLIWIEPCLHTTRRCRLESPSIHRTQNILMIGIMPVDPISISEVW
jgi:hypothetical protein